MAKSQLLAARYRGCMVGSLLGDCFGAPFEFDSIPAISVLNNHFRKLTDDKTKVPFKPYTDDTAMTKSVAESLIKRKSFDPGDMARRFVKEYYAEPRRGYGKTVVDIFAALRASKFTDPYAPAQLQFGGSGSLGNGAGMRVAPVALFNYQQDSNVAAEMAKNSALITHANRHGYNGAILQCLAVYYALHTSPNNFDPITFLQKLICDMEKIEPPHEDEIVDGKVVLIYCEKLRLVLEFLKNSDVSVNDIQERLGNNVTAPGSIPTAIYCFLRSFYDNPSIESSNGVQKTIQLAISLGGDTDTIASMAGSIAGAYYGQDNICPVLQYRCEGLDRAVAQADELYNICIK